jgi:iron(III) transport system substrate-binding protein
MRAKYAAFAAAIGFLASSTLAGAADHLVVYSAVDAVVPTVKAFSEKTGIQVDLVRLSTGELLGKVAAEGNNPKFDVLWVEGSAVMNRLADQGILKPEPGLTDKVDYTDLGHRLVPKSQAYFPITVSTTAIAINTKKLGGTEAPKTWTDLEKFAGKVAAKDPNLSGPAYQWLAGYFQAKGVDAGKAELAKILTNRAMSGIPSGGAVNKALLTGDATLAIQQDTQMYGMMDQKEPITLVYPTDGVIAIPSSAGIAKTTTYEEMAKNLIQFMLTKEGVTAMQTASGGDSYFAPVINGVQAKGSRKDNTATWQVLDDKTATEHESEWKQWFRDQFVP